MKDTARLNQASAAFAPAKQNIVKPVKLKGIEIDHKVLMFFLKHEDIFNVFGELIDFIDKIKPIPESEIKVGYDEDMDNLTYYIEVSDTITFEEDMAISDKFFDFLWNNYSKEIQKKSFLYSVNSRNFDKLKI